MFPASDVANITPAPTMATNQARQRNVRPTEVPSLSASQRTGLTSSSRARLPRRKNEFAGAAAKGNLKGRDLERTGLSCHARGRVQQASTSRNQAKRLEAAREIQYLLGSGKKADSAPNTKGYNGLNEVKYQTAGNRSALKMPPMTGRTTTAARSRTKVLLMALTDSRDQAETKMPAASAKKRALASASDTRQYSFPVTPPITTGSALTGIPATSPSHAPN